MNVLQKIVWKLYLWFFVPKNLWYCDQNNGTIIVARARLMEDHFRLHNAHARKGGQPERIPTFIFGYSEGCLSHLIFSDNPSYTGSRKFRTSDGVVGSLADFEHFRHRFPVQMRSIRIPNPVNIQNTGRVMGRLDDHLDFYQVLEYATELCQR